MTEASRTASSWVRSDNPKPLRSCAEGSDSFTERSRSIQNPKSVAIFAVVITFALCGAVDGAQPPGKVYRLGFLSPAAPVAEIPSVANLLPKLLSKSDYVEGQNLLVYRRFAEGKLDRLPQLAKELVDLRMDVIVAVSPTAIQPAQIATKTIPIVMGFGKDPVRDGFVASLARPGGNITGVVVAPEDVLAGKRLELIKEAVPRAERIAVLATRQDSSKLQIQETQKVAAPLRVKLIVIELQDGDYDRAFATMAIERRVRFLFSPVQFSTPSAIRSFNSPPNIAYPPFTNGRNMRMPAA